MLIVLHINCIGYGMDPRLLCFVVCERKWLQKHSSLILPTPKQVDPKWTTHDNIHAGMPAPDALGQCGHPLGYGYKTHLLTRPPDPSLPLSYQLRGRGFDDSGIIQPRQSRSFTIWLLVYDTLAILSLGQFGRASGGWIAFPELHALIARLFPACRRSSHAPSSWTAH
ncbi:hypothetical protein BDV26DRAFT_81043 [Aspergillus bertholletiae]|uniref:Uncharacterized protein n=1 Tax=Aspergillus bertholletiae TaxID=1226010 RepID=A0A5N7AV54_9EURO|nr:hypothetical protein BDV26DRAFT_81043 [Aspergillus bertholletiae]